MPNYYGTNGADWIMGSATGDSIWGYQGNDTLRGGDGSDQIYGDAGDDDLFENIELDPDMSADSLSGGDGNDRLWAGYLDSAYGGLGNDSLTLNYQYAPTPITGDLTAMWEGATYTIDGATISGIDDLSWMYSGHYDDYLILGTPSGEVSGISGNGGDDVLIGGAGKDYLISEDILPEYMEVDDDYDELYGLAGDDVLHAGLGDYVDGGGGVDAFGLDAGTSAAGVNPDFTTLLSTGSDTILGTQLISVEDIASVYGSSFDDVIDTSLEGFGTVLGGRDGNDSLIAGAGNNVLLGDAGNDSLNGGAGDDRLDGGAGTDSLVGGGGIDRLDGGAGTDTLDGGAGNDFYAIGDTLDTIVEAAGGGTDTIDTFLATYTLTAAHVENLDGRLDTGHTLTGSASANVISGGGGNDTLDGGGGTDTLQGGNGNDTYVVDDASDTIVEFAGWGTDEVRTALAAYTLTAAQVENLTGTSAAGQALTGSASANFILGAGGNDTLAGAGGDDTLHGGGGTDMASYSAAAAAVTANLLTGATGIGLDGFGGTDTFDGVENLTGSAFADSLTGDGGANSLWGLAGNDTLNGGEGADSLTGGAGDDIYYVDVSGDTVTELAGEGVDTVWSKVTRTLGAEIENLSLWGGATINATGNALANILTGNGAINILNGGGGADTMSGGLGHDIYIVDNVGDVVIESGSSGNDKVESSVDYSLPTHFEKLTLTGSADIDGTGNSGDNIITGNSGDNYLSAGSGDDTVTAGDGDDVIYGSAGDDALTGGAGADQFRFSTAPGTGNVDDIADFSVVDDKIWLARYAFTAFEGVSSFTSAHFRAGTAAGDATDRVIYDSATGNIYYDADGTGATAQILFATVTAGTSLTYADFGIYG